MYYLSRHRWDSKLQPHLCRGRVDRASQRLPYSSQNQTHRCWNAPGPGFETWEGERNWARYQMTIAVS